MGKYDVTIPEYTDDLGKIGAMFHGADVLKDGVTLFAAAAAIRTNVVVVSTTDQGDKVTGVSDAAKALGVAKGTVSKGVKVLLSRCPELIDCDKSEMRDRVRAFLVSLEVGGETLTSVYKSLSTPRDNGESDSEDQGDEGVPEFDESKAVALFATAIAYARKYGFAPEQFYAAALGA